MPDTLRAASSNNYLKITWENHGVSPAYNNYILKVMLISKEAGNSLSGNWQGQKQSHGFPEILFLNGSESHCQKIFSRENLISIRLEDTCGFHKKPLQLPLKKERE